MGSPRIARAQPSLQSPLAAPPVFPLQFARRPGLTRRLPFSAPWPMTRATRMSMRS